MAIFSEVPVAVPHPGYPRPVLCANDDGVLLSGLSSGRFVQLHARDTGAAAFEVRLAVATDTKAGWATVNQGSADLTTLALTLPSVPTGDQVFDGHVRCVGGAALVAAFASKAARETVLSAMSTTWQTLVLQMDPRMVGVVLQPLVDVDRNLATVVRDLSDTLASLTHLVSLVRQVPRPLAPRLAENARTDPCAEVRQENLRQLITLEPTSAVTDEACIAGIHDADPGVRLIATQHRPGAEALVVVAAILERRPASRDLRLAALEQLTRLYPATEAWPFVERSLAEAEPALRETLLQMIARAPDSGWGDKLCALALGCSWESCQSIVPLLARVKNAQVEPTLLALLAHPRLMVREAAVKALGDVGTELAIGPLVDLAQDSYLGEHVHASILHIRARTQAGDVGRVSMVASDGEAGALSIAGQVGEVELCKKDDKQD